MFKKSFKKIIAATLSVAIMFSISLNVVASGEDNVDGTMFLTHNSETDETSEIFVPTSPSEPNYTLPSDVESFEGVDPAITPYNYTSDWKRITAVKSSPYNAIVKLTTTYANGKIGYGTGFVVGDGKILTAAHNLYDSSQNKGGWAKNVKVYFGKNGSSHSQLFNATTQMTVTKNWTNATTAIERYTYDYGFITVPKAMTDKTGKFGLYAGVYVNNPYTITGYPWLEKSSTYDSNKMYTDTANATVEYGGAVKHDINICSGVSGAPMYGSNNYAVGIQTYGWSQMFNGTPDGDIGSPNQYGGFATLITQSVINFVRNN